MKISLWAAAAAGGGGCGAVYSLKMVMLGFKTLEQLANREHKIV